MSLTEEAFVGPCTAKTTIYCANIAAGLMIGQFTKYPRQLPLEADIQMNLLASELSVGRFLYLRLPHLLFWLRFFSGQSELLSPTIISILKTIREEKETVDMPLSVH